MNRLRTLVTHVLPPLFPAFDDSKPLAASHAASDETTPTRSSAHVAESSNATKGLMDSSKQAKIMKVINDYRAGADQLVQDGVLPSMSVWDLNLATDNEAGIFGHRVAGFFLDRALDDGKLDVLECLPGPWQDAKTRDARISLLKEVGKTQLKGMDVFVYAQWQIQYGDSGLTSNIVFPKLESSGSGTAASMNVIPRVVIANPGDAERISRTHVRKEGNFEPVLYDSVISTTDNSSWREQRQHLAEAFLPLSSLAKILPVSLERAKHCADRLAKLAAGGRAVDMSDFLLHEAQAQLQLALLGMPEDFMNATNSEIRGAFAGEPSKTRIGALGDAMKGIMEHSRTDHSLALPSDGCPVRGPLSRAIQNSQLPTSADYGNMLLILFAGHDTTGHTMTWLLFEIARHPEIQCALHEEVDAFFQSLDGHEPTYRDLGAGKLDLLDRCVTETLRLWPAVASGTFRQLQFSDTVAGPGNSRVTLPAGTPVNIVNWSRHRSASLWGSDADEFNPHREFRETELARVGCPMAADTPQSDRFSPFAHKPRSCLGRNFAQMEMRLILLHLIRRFGFSLAEPYDKLMGMKFGATPSQNEFHGINRATMGPKDLERSTPQTYGRRNLLGLMMHAIARET
eukprot:TRINITY_DN30265_c0_g1_i1.p1 TRINITY_DN30265_c0_g1~~TRINITY_DN30265_c0_g1_i1.p1  ORF type:complete len:627 (-),score=65.11 TRINITY_DN30265_c0_g1_i1:341-2221(-)